MPPVHPDHFGRICLQTNIGEREFGTVHHVYRTLAMNRLHFSRQPAPINYVSRSPNAGVRRANDGNALVFFTTLFLDQIHSNNDHVMPIRDPRPA